MVVGPNGEKPAAAQVLVNCNSGKDETGYCFMGPVHLVDAVYPCSEITAKKKE